jgi:hypothetical protein
MRLEKKKNIAANTSLVPDPGQCGRSVGVPDQQLASLEEPQLSDHPFVGANSFQPATLAVMAAAFDAAWHKLRSTGDILAAEFRACQTREAMALRIVAAARLGERDVSRLCDAAIAHARTLVFDFRSQQGAEPKPMPTLLRKL